MRDFRVDRQTTIFFIALGLLSLGGIWLLLYSTPYGLGLNDDSIAYIAGARSIMSGQGFREAWLISNSPMTHFPPGFPGTLALIGFISGLDPLRGARALNAVLFGLNVGLTGWLGWRMTGSRTPGLVAAALTLFSSSLLYVHSRAMSEPLYVFLTLLSFFLLDIFIERSEDKTTHTLLLAILGFVLAWAYLARYAALSLLATILAALLILHSEWRKRLQSAGILLLSTIPWILAWSIRNRLVGESFTNRTLDWHPIALENWGLAVSTFAEFLLPWTAWRNRFLELPGAFAGILVVIGLSLIIWVLFHGLPRFLRPSRAMDFNILTFTNALYVIVYLAALVATMTLFDPATRFQVRILSPIYISLILLLVVAGNWLWQRRQVLWKVPVVLSTFGLIVMFAFSQYQFIEDDLRQSGGTFANERWSESDAIAAIKQLPEDVVILTNEPGVVYLYTGRPAATLPDEEPGITAIKEPILAGKAVLVLFRVNKADPVTLSYYYELGRGLYPTDFSDTWVFSAYPK